MLNIEFVLPEENLWSDISIAHCLFPRAADEIALLGAEETGLAMVIITAADSGGGLSGHSCASLNPEIIIIGQFNKPVITSTRVNIKNEYKKTNVLTA